MDELRKKYEEIPKSELPRIWYELFIEEKWSSELGEEPENFKGFCPELHYINQKMCEDIGEKAFYRYLNVDKGSFTNQLFDDWWESRNVKKPKYNFFDKCDKRNNQCKNGKSYIDSIFFFSLGILFTKFIEILICICT